MIEAILVTLNAHPALVGLAWAMVTSVVLALFKPRSPEEYAAMEKDFPRWVRFLKFLSATGLDPVKLLESIKGKK